MFGISQTNILYGLNKRIQNVYYEYTSVIGKASPQIVVIEIDEDTLTGRKDEKNNLIEPGLGRFPFNRTYYARMIDQVVADNP